MVDVKDEDVVAGCVAALAEDAYEMVELEFGEVGVSEVADEREEDEEEVEEEIFENDEVDTWPDGTE